MAKSSEQYRNELEELAVAIYEVPAHCVAEIRAVYEALSDEAVEVLGADHPCSVTDPLSYQVYSDIYKDMNGFRPRDPIPRAHVRSWLLSLSDTPRD